MIRFWPPLAVLAIVVAAASGGAETGDALCDGATSTQDTCVVAGSFVVPDSASLAFTSPNVEVRGTITVQFLGHCSTDFSRCASDADCVAPAHCDGRTGRLALQAAGGLVVDRHAGPTLAASGHAAASDTVGSDGGAITLTAGDLTIAGRIDASASGTTGVPAGGGGRIELDATGSVTLSPTAQLDVSSTGGCGGAIVVAGPLTVSAAGTLTAVAATLGGSVDIAAVNYASAPAAISVANVGDVTSRPPCARGGGGGTVAIRAARVDLTGSISARGNQAAGGVVRLEGAQGVTVNTAAGITVRGGDTNAFTTGGGVFLVASGGDVTLQQGPIDASGIDTGIGSDAGLFDITAGMTTQCAASGGACSGDGDCPSGDRCTTVGGNVTIADSLSAHGGAGAGSGCIECNVQGDGVVKVTAPIDVGGGRRFGVGGKVTIAAGSDLTIGPGAITSEASAGGDVILIAGERSQTTRDLSGVLRLLTGTQVWANAFPNDGFGGQVALEACTVELDQTTGIHADGGSAGGSDGVAIVAHDRLVIGALAAVSALPNGALEFSYGHDVSIAPDADLQPPADVVQDPTIPPCPACGNGVVELGEACDGRGTCAVPTDICVPPGAPDACSCQDTCGTVAGIQAGEDCDGADLGGQTCVSLGFPGGTLGCTPDCQFDTTHCTAAVCGDGIAGAGEACDPGGGGVPPAFGGATCQSLGYPSGGTLACTADCAAIVTGPHCAGDVADACTASATCGAAGPCVGGCIACGNGFVDPGETCDDGEANGNGPNQCRLDCTLPRCGDGIVDFPHCAGDPGAACGSANDCPAGVACLGGETCDQGQATCAGGTNDGRPCCRADDCPGGACGGDDCSRNRDDIPGCCRCDCTTTPPTCGNCDDGNPCTTDACGPNGCAHTAVPDGTSCGTGDACHESARCESGACTAGAAVSCGDGDTCTTDTCDPARGCQHERIGFADVRQALEASVFVPACDGDKVPRSIPRLMARAHGLVSRAAEATPVRAARLLRRATRRLRTALARSRRPHGAACRTALAQLLTDALARVGCLQAGPGS